MEIPNIEKQARRPRVTAWSCGKNKLSKGTGEEKIKTRKEGKWAERERTSIVDFDIFIMIIGMVPVVCAKPSRMEESERWQVADHRKSS